MSHMSILKNSHSDRNYIIQWDFVLFNESLSYKEDLVAILDREVHNLRTRVIPYVKVQWEKCPVEEDTLKTESDIHRRYPQEFIESGNICFIPYFYPFLLILFFDNQ